MRNEDIYTGLGALLSAISSALSYIWGIPSLQFFFTFILGSLVTYFIQSRLQDRAEKRKITREKIEKIYGPLWILLQEIEKKLINDLQSCRSLVQWGQEKQPWEKIKAHPEFFSIPPKLRDEAEEVIHRAKKLDGSLSEIKRIVDIILIEIGTSVFKTHYKEVGARISKNSGQGYLWIAAKSKTGVMRFSRGLRDYVILNMDPIEDVKLNSPDSYPQECIVHLMVEEDRPNLTIMDHHIDVPLIEIQKNLNLLLDKAKQKVAQEQDVLKFQEERSELSRRISGLLLTIKKHITKHYPVEEV